MKSIKAIVAGSLFIIITILLLQLAYIFIAVGYNSLAVDFPFLHDISGIFRYLVGLPVFMLTIFCGGYITAYIADMHDILKVGIHCIVVASISIGGMTFSAMDYSSLTITGIVVLVLALSASSAGGFYWLRRHKIIPS